MLGDFLEAHGIRQTEFAEDLSAERRVTVDKAQVNRWARNPESNLTRENIDAILAVLNRRLGRPVTYEEVFGAALPPAANE